MIQKEIEQILEKYKKGEVTKAEIVERLKNLSFESLEFAKIDHNRVLRRGFPEVIFCEGKTPEQTAQIAIRIVSSGNNLLATRANTAHFQAVSKVLPKAEFFESAKVITYSVRKLRRSPKKKIVVISAGTSDIPVAEEAYITASMMGNNVEKIYDVGVAGIHRLLHYMDILKNASVIIVVAGMEGALASVVGGLVDKPVIGVPTSIGYGASFNGIAALLGMLNSCAGGVTVVNIDNGFGAAFAASLILKS